MLEGDSEDSDDSIVDTTTTTEIIYDGERISSRLFKEICKTKVKLDICIKITDPFISLIIDLIIKAILELKENKKIKSSRFIIEITQDNVNYCKQLISMVDEIRHLDGIKGNFLTNESTYASITTLQKPKPITQLIISNVGSFVEQQQLFFDLLWNKSIPAIQKIKEIEGVKERGEKKEIALPPPPPLPIKTEVIQDQKELLKILMDFYKNSDEIRYCSPVESINLINRNFSALHQEILDKYKNGKHKGIRWITSINNNNDIELVKTFLGKGITIKHVKDLSSAYFALSDKMLLFTIEKIEEGNMVTNVIFSNETLYIDHYGTVFESLWKKSIDIHDRIKAIEDDQYIDAEVIPNPKESLKLLRELFNNAKSEILLILSSANANLRIETNFRFKFFDDLALKGIKVKILIPLGRDLHIDISQIKSKYPNIEFRNFYTDLKTITGVVIVDEEKVLLLEIKDDTKSFFVDSIGTAIFIKGKSTALSYFSIFDSLWKQAELYDELKKAYEKIQNHDKMQKEFINTAAHELRTPLQPIIGIATILNREIQSKRHKELSDVLIRNVQRLKTLSKDILDVTRIESDSLNLDKEYFTIKEIMLEIIDNYKNEVATKNITLEYISSDDLNNVVVYADKNRIIQAISNLICNSIKFIDKEKEKGIISIDVKRRKVNDGNAAAGGENKNMAIVTVKDNGIGIDKEILPRLFTKFASKSFQGPGLGLYISKNIIEAHGGKMWTENSKDDSGKGAIFSFSLPIVN